MANNDEVDELVEELAVDQTDAVSLSEEELIRKYDEGQARIIVQRNDFLVPNIRQMVENRDILNISPNYQRRKRWNDQKRSRLIESLLMNIPIPPIFLYESDLAKYEVMDGQQRLDTIRGFFKNEFPLTGLEKWSGLNECYYRDLPDRIQRGLERRGLAAVIILTESGQTPEAALDIRQSVFERLNTGGEKLNPQEVRNCIFAGNFNDTINNLARSAPFTAAWQIPPKEANEPHEVSTRLRENKLYASMSDCEIVLRYFALRDLNYFSSGMKKTLDECMRRMGNASAKECGRLRAEYLRALRIASRTYGECLFRLLNRKGELKGRRSIPLSDAVMVSIHSLGDKAAELPKRAEDIKRRTKALLDRNESYEVLVGRANTKAAVEKRFELMTKTFRKSLRA